MLNDKHFRYLLTFLIVWFTCAILIFAATRHENSTLVQYIRQGRIK